ncbi:MAG: peptide MFS transporter [Ignavibacteria bacterium]|nr:peptide MFS transporter [Ignavibacteria bacterium]
MEQTEKLKHPGGLFLLFFTEMWERFSFYGMQAVFYLYMIHALTFDKTYADLIYGNYTGMVYITALIGGFVSDRYFGNRKSIVTGGVMMAAGQFLLFTSGLMFETKPMASGLLYAGLILLCLGNGFFKPNISSMVGQLYPEGDKRIDAAFTIFYMGINMGGLLAPIICGFLGNTGNLADFKWGYFAAGIGMILSLVVFIPLKKKYVVRPDGTPVGAVPPAKIKPEVEDKTKGVSTKQVVINLSVFAALFILFYFILKADTIGSFIYSTFFTAPLSIITDRSLTKIEKQKIVAMFILVVFTMIFWIAFGQIGSSLTYFADNSVDRSIFGWSIPPSVFQAFGPLFIVSFAPLMAIIWTFLAKKNSEPSIPFKLALGLLLMSIAWVILAYAVTTIPAGVKVGMGWLILMYFVLTIGELSLSPIGLSMIVKLAPIRFGSVLMAVWFLSLGTSFKLSGVLSAFYPTENHHPLLLGIPINTNFDFFLIFVVLAGVSAIILFILIKPLLKVMHGVK